MNKRFISLALACVIGANMLSVPASASYDGSDAAQSYYEETSDTDLNVTWNTAVDNRYPATSFSDVKPGNWFYNDVMECARLGIVGGFEDGTFKPQDNVTYAQLVVMLTRTFYNDWVNLVTDTVGKPWYYANMKTLVDAGMDNGTDIKNKGGWPVVLVANNNINRYEMARLLHNIICQKSKDASVDAMNAAVSQIGDWAQVQKDLTSKGNQLAVKDVYALGIITGMSDGTFSGKQNMTRAQACTVMMRMLKLINGYNPDTGDTGNTTPATGTNDNTFDNGKLQPVTGNNSTGATLANGQPATVENALAIIEQLKLQYPEGTHWGTSTESGTKYYANGNKSAVARVVSASTVYACGGFAAMVSDAIFGQDAPCRQLTDYSKVRPGDIIVQLRTNGTVAHVSVVTGAAFQTTGLSGTKYWSVCASDGNVRDDSIGRVSWSDNGATKMYFTFGTSTIYKVYTRWPD